VSTVIKLPTFDRCVAERDGGGWWVLKNRLTNEIYLRRENRLLPRGLRARPAIAGYLYALAQIAIVESIPVGQS